MQGRRTKADFAKQLRIIVDERYPDPEVMVLLVGNLNTRGPWVLYEPFPPEEAKLIDKRIEWPYITKHDSWLNMAERYQTCSCKA